jgi:hypothetical protein
LADIGEGDGGVLGDERGFSDVVVEDGDEAAKDIVGWM